MPLHTEREREKFGFGQDTGQWALDRPWREVIGTSGSLATSGAISKIWFRSSQKLAIASDQKHPLHPELGKGHRDSRGQGSHLHDSNIHHEAKAAASMLHSGLTIYKNWFNQLWNNCSNDTSWNSQHQQPTAVAATNAGTWPGYNRVTAGMVGQANAVSINKNKVGIWRKEEPWYSMFNKKSYLKSFE